MSTKVMGNIHVGFGEYNKEAGRLYDEGWERIFGEAARKNKERPAEERAREAADAGKRHASKVQARTARARAAGDRHIERIEAKDKAAKEGT